MNLNSSNSLHAGRGRHAGVANARSTIPLSCSRLASSRPGSRPFTAAPTVEGRSSRPFDGIVRRVAEASPPAEAADVQISLNNDEDQQYTVSGGHLELRRWRCVGILRQEQ